MLHQRTRNFTSKRELDDAHPPASRGEAEDHMMVKATGKNTKYAAMFEAGVATAERRQFTSYPDMPQAPPPGSPPEKWDAHWRESERIRAQGPTVATSSNGTVRRTRERAVHNRR